MTYAGFDLPYGHPTQTPVIAMENADPIRLYSLPELREILSHRNMTILAAYADFDGKEPSDRDLQLIVYAQKTPLLEIL